MRKFPRSFLLFGAGLLLTSVAIYILFVKTPSDLARNIAEGIGSTFNFTPQVKIDETVVIEQNAPIAELATVSRDLMVEYGWSHRWVGSTKTIRLRGVFQAKAGFNLKEPFTITILQSPLRVHASMPPPKILSVQMNDYKVLEDESGWWNKISDKDRQAAVQELLRAAREKAEQSGMLGEAQSTIEQRIKELAEQNGAMVEFVYPWQES